MCLYSISEFINTSARLNTESMVKSKTTKASVEKGTLIYLFFLDVAMYLMWNVKICVGYWG